jgi:electron transport complex protein RnfG
MNEEQIKPPTASAIVKSIRNNSFILGVFALMCTAVIAATFMGTEDNIALQKRAARLKALVEIIPHSRHNNDLLADSVALKINELGHRKTEQIFLARNNNQPVAIIYPVTAREGYSGDIDYIIGINLADASIAGVRVLSHKETPGLGDKIDLRKSNWILNFNDRSLGNPTLEKWRVKKDGGTFDSFTGATITPRALIQSIAMALEYHRQQHKNLLLAFSKNHNTGIE